MDVPDTDETLWLRAGHGDADAFAAVFERHADAVYTHCARRTGSWTDAQDLTSLVFLQAWRRRGRVRFVDGSALPWLLVVATNLARNDARARRRFARALARVHADPPTPDIADEVIRGVAADELAVRVAACLHRLRRDEQDVLALCDMGELSYAEAAAALQIPVGTVRSRLSRARGKVRAMLAEADAAPRDHPRPDHLQPDHPQPDQPQPDQPQFDHTPGGSR